MVNVMSRSYILLLSLSLATQSLPASAAKEVEYPPKPYENQIDATEKVVPPSSGRFRGSLLLGERELEYAVDLETDGSFRRREVLHSGSGAASTTMETVGRYAFSPDGRRLILTATDRSQHLIDVFAADAWRASEFEGLTRVAEGEIHRDDQAKALEVNAEVRAELYSSDGQPRVRDCGSGLEMAISGDRKLKELLRQQSADSAPWLLALEGKVAAVKAGGNTMTGAQVLAQQSGGCKAAAGATDLADTYWKFVSVGGEAVKAAPGQRTAHLRFVVANGRFLGQGICNRLGGSFDTVGEVIRLRQIDQLPTPCPPGGMSDASIIDALTASHRYRVKGTELQLLSAKGKVLVKLSSAAAPAGR